MIATLKNKIFKTVIAVVSATVIGVCSVFAFSSNNALTASATVPTIDNSRDMGFVNTYYSNGRPDTLNFPALGFVTMYTVAASASTTSYRNYQHSLRLLNNGLYLGSYYNNQTEPSYDGVLTEHFVADDLDDGGDLCVGLYNLSKYYNLEVDTLKPIYYYSSGHTYGGNAIVLDFLTYKDNTRPEDIEKDEVISLNFLKSLIYAGNVFNLVKPIGAITAFTNLGQYDFPTTLSNFAYPMATGSYSVEMFYLNGFNGFIAIITQIGTNNYYPNSYGTQFINHKYISARDYTYASGIDTGYTNGYGQGLTDGINNAQSSYTDGFNAGKNIGYNEGVVDGTESGYNTAKDELTNYYEGAIDNAYNRGKNDGIEQSSEFTFFGLISAVVDAPLSAFTSFFNFEILGINILDFVKSIISIALVYGCIRIILKGS